MVRREGKRFPRWVPRFEDFVRKEKFRFVDCQSRAID